MVRIILISSFSFFFITSFLFAQMQSGAIEGSVQDVEGQPVPGATVTVSSPSLIGRDSTTFTDRNGYYRFPYLTSGTYEVRAELQGFQTVIRKNIGVSVGQTMTVHFTMEVASVAEVVEITEKVPLIDISTTAVSFTVPPEIIHNLPKIDEIQFLMALTPGVSDDLVAYGADGKRANNIRVDGLSVSNERTGTIAFKYNYNWIDEVQVIGIGAPAEYGAFTGVIGNFITRSGGNKFHGLFDTFFQNENLTSTNIPNPGPEEPFETYDVSAQLGGPILRDKLWFFSGIQYPQTQTPAPGFDEITTEIYKKLITKLTYKLNQDNTLQGFAHWNGYSFEREGSNAKTLPEANFLKSENPEWSWNTIWISLLSSQTTFEGRLAGFYDHFKDIEENPNLSSHYDGATDIYSVNSLARRENKQTRLQMNAALSHHAQDFIEGSHDFRFGIEYERSGSLMSYQYNGDMQYYDYYGAPYLRLVGGSYISDGLSHRVSSYAQDNWNITDRLNLSLGVRWDHNVGGTPRRTYFRTDPVAPRIGFVWTLNQDSQTVIKAHYGDYYEGILGRNYFFLNDDLEFESLFVEKYIDGEWVRKFEILGRSVISDGKFKQPYVRQFSIGIDRILPGNIPIGAHYIYRRFGNSIKDVGQSEYEPVPFLNPIDGRIITVYNLVKANADLILTNPPGIRRRYHGIEIYANKQFADTLSLSASLVYSTLTGNDPNTLSFLDDPNTLINIDGRLGIDRTISWKVVGTYALPLGFNTGFYFRHESGDTWTAEVPVPGLNQEPKPYYIFGEPFGSRRLPSHNLLDLRVEKLFALPTGQLRFTIDIFNVFNSAYPLAVQSDFTSEDFGTPFRFSPARTARLGIRYTF